MPVSIYERFDSGNGTFGGTNPSRELTFTITGSESTADAQAALEGTIPALWNGLYFQDYSLEHLGAGVWTATARYGPAPKPDVGQQAVGTNTSPRLTQDQREPALGEYTLSFDTTGGTTKITQSKSTVKYSRPASGDVAPDHKGAIQVSADDNVEGCEITVPVFNMVETHHVPAANVTGDYMRKLYYLTGRINDAPWRGFAKHELLFLGSSGSGKWSDGWELTFRFAAQPNVTGMAVGEVTGVAKNGWDFMWVAYGTEEDGAAKALAQRPRYVYVERVYDEGSFLDLGIGV